LKLNFFALSGALAATIDALKLRGPVNRGCPTVTVRASNTPLTHPTVDSPCSTKQSAGEEWHVTATHSSQTDASSGFLQLPIPTPRRTAMFWSVCLYTHRGAWKSNG